MQVGSVEVSRNFKRARLDIEIMQGFMPQSSGYIDTLWLGRSFSGVL